MDRLLQKGCFQGYFLQACVEFESVGLHGQPEGQEASQATVGKAPLYMGE